MYDNSHHFFNVHVHLLTLDHCDGLVVNMIPYHTHTHTHSGPVPVLVMSLLFIACVFLLHIWGRYTRS